MVKPKISVLIPTYNRPEFLREALESVVIQTVKPYEVIVADDNQNESQSKKNKEVVEEFSKRYPFIIYHKNEKNYGPAGNYANLFKLATGELIHFLRDSDILSPVALEKLSKPLIDNKQIYVSAGKTFFSDINKNISYIYYYIDARVLEATKLFKNNSMEGLKAIEYSYSNMMLNIFGSFSGFMFRKKDVDFPLFEFNGYKIETNADIYFWMNLAKKGNVFLYNHFLNIFRYHGQDDQSNLSVYLKGLEEMLLFYTREYMDHIGISLTKDVYAKNVEEFLYLSLVKGLKSDYIDYYLSKSESFKVKNERKAFSIIVVTYKNEETIGDCINSFIETLSENDEVIIIDNSPDDKTELAVKNLNYKNLKFIKSEENIGYARAINKGVKLAKNELLVFLNPDTVVISKDWLNKFSYHLSKSEKVAAVGPVSDSAFFYNKVYNYIIPDLFRLLNPFQISNLLGNIYENTKVNARILSGFCLATKKDIFLRYGMFDESLVLGFDDLDYSIYLNEANYEQIVIPSVYIQHKNHVSFEKDIEKSSYLNQLSLQNFMKKLIRKYGYGNIPEPLEYFSGDIISEDYPFFPSLKKGRYRFAFNFSKTLKDKNFFREKAKVIKSYPKVAIITVNYKSHRDVLELAESILKEKYKNIDFVVVDNSEDDAEFENLREGLEKLFKDSYKNYYLLENINNGYAGGNNLGIKFAIQELKAEYIWLLNPDTVISEGSLLELLRTVEFTDVPVATCKILDYHDSSCQYNGKIVSFNKDIDCNTYGVFRLAFLSGANIFLKKDVIEKIGFFDERYFLYYEDNDYFKRLTHAGIFPLFTPFVHIYHKGGSSTEGFLKKPMSIYYFTRNMLHWYKLNFDISQLWIPLDLIKNIYLRNISKTANLMAVLLGIEDFLNGVYGKVEKDFRYKTQKKTTLVQNTNLKENLENILNYMKQKPKDYETFNSLVDLLLRLKISYYL